MKIIKNQYLKRIIILLLSTIALIIAGNTFALLKTVSESKSNVVSGKRNKVNIGIVEKNSEMLEPMVFETNEGLTFTQPPTQVADYYHYPTKTVALKNIDLEDYPTKDTLVRLRIVANYIYDDTSPYANTSVPIDESQIQITVNNLSNSWTTLEQDKQMYYYYKLPLAPSQLTSYIDIDVDYLAPQIQDAHLNLQVLAEGVSYNSTNHSDGWKFAKMYWSLSDEQVNLIVNH